MAGSWKMFGVEREILRVSLEFMSFEGLGWFGFVWRLLGWRMEFVNEV